MSVLPFNPESGPPAMFLRSLQEIEFLELQLKKVCEAWYCVQRSGQLCIGRPGITLTKSLVNKFAC